MSSPDYLQNQLAQANAQIQGMHSELARLAARLTNLERQQGYGASGLPDSKVFSPNFWTRALAIFGHSWVIGMIISVVVWLVAFVITLILGLSLSNLY